MDHQTLKITILVPGIQTLSKEMLEKRVAQDVLDWVHSDDSGLAGVPDASVKVELIGNGQRGPGRFWGKDYHQTGEQIVEVD